GPRRPGRAGAPRPDARASGRRGVGAPTRSPPRARMVCALYGAIVAQPSARFVRLALGGPGGPRGLGGPRGPGGPAALAGRPPLGGLGGPRGPAALAGRGAAPGRQDLGPSGRWRADA